MTAPCYSAARRSGSAAMVSVSTTGSVLKSLSSLAELLMDSLCNPTHYRRYPKQPPAFQTNSFPFSPPLLSSKTIIVIAKYHYLN
ncbi:hypothetical protein ACTXT7_008480 [Hymenolepis weldensis]